MLPVLLPCRAARWMHVDPQGPASLGLGLDEILRKRRQRQWRAVVRVSLGTPGTLILFN